MDWTSELDAYFEELSDGRFGYQFQSEVNLLSRISAEKFTQQVSGLPTLAVLGGFVLDDPETSDHHVFVTKSPVAGQILYLCHDGDTRIVFASLRDFVDAARRAVAEDRYLSELHPVCSPICEDQAGLSNLIRKLSD